MSSNMMISGKSVPGVVSFTGAVNFAGSALSTVAPSDPVVGDILLKLGAVNDAAAVTWDLTSTDNVFTERMDTGASPSLAVGTRVAGGSENANNTADLSASVAEGTLYCVRLRGAAYDAIGAAVVVTADGAVNVPSVTSSVGGIVLCFLAAEATGAALTLPTGFTSVFNQTISGVMKCALGWKEVLPGATGALAAEVSSSGGNQVAGVLIAFK